MINTASNDSPHYLNDAHKAPELDRELEARLVQRWKAGDDKARNELVRNHQRHVVAQAWKYRRYGVPIAELVAEGNLGVVYALGKFQPQRGVRFGTYAAYWVRAQMLAHVVRSNRAVSGSDGPLRSQMFFKLRRERTRVFNQLGSGEHAERELAARLGVSLERVRAMVARLDGRDVALDAPAAGSGIAPVEQLEAPHDQERELGQCQLGLHLRHALGQALQLLDRRERQIVELRLMADEGQALTLAELARRMGISRERARQLEKRALSKLRQAITSSPDRVVREWIETEVTAA